VLVERVADWATVPNLRVEDLERHVEALGVDDDLFAGEFRVMPTGGTSGRRTIHAFDKDEWIECLAAFMRWSDLIGLRPRLPRLRIATITAVGARHMTSRFGTSVDVGVHRTLRLDATRPSASMAAQLEDFRPHALIGFASAVAQLACDQLDGRLSIQPRVVATSSEVRTPDMQEHIRQAWGVTPFDLFGSTEALYAGDCKHHNGMHVFEDQTYVEVIDSKLVLTSLIRRTQPLIRYEIGDIAQLTTDPCACGRAFARLTAVEGRADDVLRLPATSGGHVDVHPIAIRSPLAGIAELRRYKVIHDSDGLHIRVELREGGQDRDVAQRISSLVRQRLAGAGAVVEPDVQIYDALPPDSESGKFRLIERRA
jgi:phenylacetate-CoA ligase